MPEVRDFEGAARWMIFHFWTTLCSEAISGQTARPIGIPRPDSARRVPDCELTPKFGTFFQSEGGLNWLQPEVMKIMQFYLMNLAILRVFLF